MAAAMARHPIRIVLGDDLRRTRVTVLLRLLLAIPHYVWLALWTIAAIVAAIASWFATLVQGQTPEGLHGFLSAYLRYLVRLHGYLLLTADPYPPFTGGQGYPIDLEIDPPAPQHRGRTAARILLAVPAFVLTETLVGWPDWGWRRHDRGGFAWYSESGAAVSVAVLAWFACLARASMPRGFRDLQAFALRYAAQTWGYLLLLTDRYPDARPADPPAAAPETPHPVGLVVTDDLRRSRLTVLFRLLLVLPHVIWIALWLLALIPTLIVAWALVLARGSLPPALHRFVTAYLRYQAQLGGYLSLAANPYPAFTGTPGYPVDVELPEGPEPQSRGKTAVRLLLAIPAWVVAGGLGGVAFVAAVLGWFASLWTGRMPRGLRDLAAWSIRYTAQADAFLFFVTERYPYAGPYEFAEAQATSAAQSPYSDV
jgi:Domain of unknown function (DUF4389)